MTVRKAVDNLVNEGTLYRVPAKGTFIAKRKPKRSKTRTVGYFLDNRIAGGLSSPYHAMLFNAIEKQTSAQGYALIYFTNSAQTKIPRLLKKLDGVIASCFPRAEQTVQEIKALVQVVAVDNSLADKTIPSVIVDSFNAEAEAVDHLCSLGHERIGFMTGLEESDVGKNRYEGYRNGLANNGLKSDMTLVFRGNYTFDSGASGIDYFLSLKKRPSAIVCASDSMALGAISQLHKEGLSVPGDMSIIGFNDIDVARQITPPLSTIAVPVEEIARRAFAMLECLIDGKPLENRHVALEAHLVDRSTCGEPGGDTVDA